LYGIPDNQPILGKFTILNDDIVTRFSVSDVSGNEGTAVSGSTALSFVVSRDNADAAGSVTYSFANATTDGSDFVGGLPAGGTVNFAAGVFTQTVTVNVSPDFAIEGNETFQINLGTATGGTILDGQGIGTIVNDDTAGSLIVSNPVVNEAAGTMTFDISRSAGARGDVDFTFQANTFPGAGSATSGADYTSTPQTFQLRNGQTTASYTINILDDGIVEGNETVSLVLTNSTVASFSGGTGTIVDNDVGGAFSVADVTITEGDTGSQSGQFIVTRSAAGGNALGAAAISYTIVDAGSSAQTTATFGSDYTASRSGTLTFAPGQTSATVPFTVIGDTTAEGNETFRLQLASQSTGTIARGVGTATIVDNDGTPPPVAPNTPGLQQGTSGNDVLISTNQGNSILAGGRGDDTYLVYAQGDVVIEAVNEGNDILYTTVSYSLGENQVEAMSVADQMTTNSINLIGNYVSQIIVGNYGDNVLNGGSGGVDTLIGLFGNDTYAVGDARTVIVEQAGQGSDTAVTSVSYTLGAGVSVEVFAAQNAASTTGLRLGGNELAQTIAGTAGADTISGGGGRDVLLGGAGADTFVIGAVAAGNVAVLADFVAGTDRIGLTSTAFNVGTSLDAAEFVAGTAATTADQRVIYDAGTGQLFYDADGNGAGAAVLFAQVVPGTAITAASFDVVVPTATTA
jgi:Ca2+-binding RTX toxin-like protein